MAYCNNLIHYPKPGYGIKSEDAKRQPALPFRISLSRLRQYKHPVRVDLKIVRIAHVRLQARGVHL